MPAPKIKTLTIKERGFVRDYIKTGSAKEAVKRNYDVAKDSTARQIAHQVKRKPHIQKAITTALRGKGLTEDRIAEVLKENIESGLGVKATATDSLRGIDIWARLTGAYNSPKALTTYKETITELDTGALIKVIEKQQMLTTTLLKELQDK